MICPVTSLGALACFFDKKFLFVISLVLASCVQVLAAEHFQEAANAFQRGDIASAEAILAEDLRSQPNDAAALGLLAVVLDTQKKYPEAGGVYRRALALTPNSASLLKVVALRPDHPNANLQLAAIAADQKNGPEALRYLHHLGTSQPSTPQFILLRMRALYLCGRDAEGNALLLRLSDSAAHDPQLTFSAGLALASVAKYEQAEDFFSRTLEAEPCSIISAWPPSTPGTGSGRVTFCKPLLPGGLRMSTRSTIWRS